MLSPKTELETIFEKAIQKSFPEEARELALSPDIKESTQPQFGHYQFNSAMKLSKILKIPPRQVAEMITANVDKGSIIESLEIAGPGFINITLSPNYLEKSIKQILKGENFERKTKQKIIIDFSSPNIAKELHVGHLRSTIIGDSLSRLFEFLGHDVLRLNHIGDWGTQFGMLIAYLKEECKEILTGEKAADLAELMGWYKQSKARFDADPEFKKRAQKEVYHLQSGDKESLEAWKMICDISKKGYQEIYELLDVSIEDRGESFYNPFLKSIVEDFEKKGLVTTSQGAKCLFLEGFASRDGTTQPLIIQKQDGGYLYATTDLAAIRQRIQEEKADRIIYVTDAGQSLHFNMIFKAAEAAGYLDRTKTKVDHVPFGLVLGTDGKKFKTRSGETEKLIDLLTKAIEKARLLIEERNLEMTPSEKEDLAKKLGIGAVKYADLSSHRTSDYVFSYDRMLRFEGNTAAYLMYSYVRIQSIKRKVGIDPLLILEKTDLELTHPSEIALGLHLTQFGDVLEQVSADLLPNRLTEYLYSLSNHFNAFFRDCRVEGTSQEKSRLLLAEAAAKTLKQGLFILGVETVERM